MYKLIKHSVKLQHLQHIPSYGEGRFDLYNRGSSEWQTNCDSCYNLRPFIYDPNRSLPLSVAQQNEQEFVVEAILGHRGSRNRRSTLAFKVRWAGFGDEHDSWEPYKGLMHVGKLHDYLRANHMKALIPKEHR